MYLQCALRAQAELDDGINNGRRDGNYLREGWYMLGEFSEARGRDS